MIPSRVFAHLGAPWAGEAETLNNQPERFWIIHAGGKWLFAERQS